MNKGYTIPIVDISDEDHRQVIVDKEENLYLGHPTTVLMDDNKTMFTVYPKNHGFGQVVLKKSEDGGLSWSERLPVPDSWSTSLECPMIYKLKDKEGVERLFMFSGRFPGRMSYSEDLGETWTELTPMGDYGGIVFLSCVVDMGDGEYMGLFHDEGHYIHGGCKTLIEVHRAGKDPSDYRTKLIMRDSPDGGKTWGSSYEHFVDTLEKEGDEWGKIYETVAGKRFVDDRFEVYTITTRDGGLSWSEPKMLVTHKSAKLCEPFLIKSPDEKEMLVLLRENSRKYNSFMIRSQDNGKTWSEPVELPGALTGDRHYGKYLKDGRLFISFRDMAEESKTKGDWVGWVGTYDDIVNLREGQYRVLIKKNHHGSDCAYPGVEVLEDETIVTTTYGHWKEDEAPYILSVRFKLEELDEYLK